MADELNLIAMRKPAPFVTLPNGARFQLKYFDAPEFRLHQQLSEDPGNVTILAELLMAVLPGAAVKDIDSLGLSDMHRVLGLAQDKIQIVEAVLKNGASGVGSSPPASPSTATDSPPLSPTT